MARIAVIGAGMGSLAAAARLAVAGHRVVVYERARTYGGGVGQLARDGFAFDTGPGLLLLPAVYRDLFVKTGREPLEQCVDLVQVDPSGRHLLADGRELTLPNASRGGVVAALDKAFGGGAGERWSTVLNRAREVWEVTRRPLLEDTLAPDTAPLGRDPYPAPRRGLLRRAVPPTIASVGRHELRDPGLAALLDTAVLEYGLDPRSAPASATVLPYMEQTFGTWYVRGGLRALADAVYARCLARGVEFRFGTGVEEVPERDGRVDGVVLSDGTHQAADAVVRGTPGRALDGDTGRLTVCLALRGPRPPDTAHRTVVHGLAAPHDGTPDGPAPTVTVLRPDDPALVPDADHEAVRLGVTVCPHGPGAVDWDAPGYARAFADRVVAAARAAIPDLPERELWRVVRTPADTERETGAPGGAVAGPALAGAAGAYLRTANRPGPQGLYRVGGSAHPGGGLPHAGMSGAIVADLLAGGPGGSR
ncbi:phytoene desaturase family protein [Streptantibioticus silvisoli]|uniref:NAD(P)/FAD-dependent oxidoreductase n=1 Tax=Streptantibioticus silvisoli TaxID=2705255 RepID=A0ABT6W0V6_9ACTN|nr:NAD(P)/FAD-dependent oxidoreductase [Streptantibioticus silvisoli]MDI5963572.1 NAD(P)/FAD-dependent oxidoreductase [Streptantibioticus silvisoli]